LKAQNAFAAEAPVQTLLGEFTALQQIPTWILGGVKGVGSERKGEKGEGGEEREGP